MSEDRDPLTTIGIDLATQPNKTAICSIVWSPDHATVSFDNDKSDQHIVELIASATKVGLDCPLGWPEAFVQAITAHSQMAPWPGRDLDPEEFRRTLMRRETDREVHSSGRPPLSVSTDRIGIVAMRFADIADALARRGYPVERSGSGVLAEVYPAAALRAWGFADRHYKKKDQQHAVAALVDAFMVQMPWLRFVDAQAEVACRNSHDALDAMICALVARAVSQGCTQWPTTDEAQRLASIEGWIHVPSGDPKLLLSSSWANRRG